MQATAAQVTAALASPQFLSALDGIFIISVGKTFFTNMIRAIGRITMLIVKQNEKNKIAPNSLK